MSEPTYQDDAPARDDWSKVHTGLDWVVGWMSDRGYTDTEIAYVVDRPVSALVAEDVLAPVEVPVEVPPAADVAEVLETSEPVWTIPLTVSESDTDSEEHAPVDTDDSESTEHVPA